MQDRLDLIAKQIDKSQKAPQQTRDGKQYMLRDLALEVVRGTAQHGDASEDQQLGALFRWVAANVEYRQDPVWYDQYQTAGRTLQGGGSDCFTLDTKVIVRSKATCCYELRTLAELEHTWPAYEALSYDFSRADWVFAAISGFHRKPATEVWETHLATGAVVRHTPDHRVWWLDGSGSAEKLRVVERPLGSALEEERTYFRRVLIAKQIPALGLGDMSRAQAYLSGIYTAEGYRPSGRVQRGAFIAQDKPEIRERIEEAMAHLGLDYTPSARTRHASYYIKASDFGAWLRRHGGNSFDMSFPPEILSLSAEQTRVVLEAHGDGDGWRPKSGSPWEKKLTAIHTTSSSALAEGLQVLCMILGEPWYTQFQKNHGGSGHHPIYRVHRWKMETRPGRRVVPELPGLSYSGTRAITPLEEPEEVACITVPDTGNFLLANGMLVHNCDCHTILIGGMAASLGFPVGAKCVSRDGLGWHIYAIAGVRPFYQPTAYVALDTSMASRGSYPGWEPPPSERQHEYIVSFDSGRAVGLRRT
jgi:hypothetical protein